MTAILKGVFFAMSLILAAYVGVFAMAVIDGNAAAMDSLQRSSFALVACGGCLVWLTWRR